ncbi:hypothetical protein CY34DRAFT_728579 [Suillus luteus UH-Slu-Lm8-n1]|uniref:Uncharacterized protein n=1 Tax=Suillus luteus UH-Slu-Lm8-n1 TaxID=930992 RepID=A0A0D0AMT6_9AGAM|nr:hypothetical protein CY34DRAFT_728579 [Suillus luteus UH-Slu-Lm8-n1]
MDGDFELESYDSEADLILVQNQHAWRADSFLPLPPFQLKLFSFAGMTTSFYHSTGRSKSDVVHGEDTTVVRVRTFSTAIMHP